MATEAEARTAKEDGGSPAMSERRPRLVIKEMVLRNFKSYAGEQRIGPFHKSFSAVVGPNGSGKSNVIDAMLFVFGKRAKQMRLNKVSELIHNSSNHQNLECAGVSVYFEEIIDMDDGTIEGVKGSEFVITRVAFRDNTSKYYVNNRGSNFTEVTKMLKGKGVDLDNNRFLILQGEVEQISLMKPKAQGPNDEGFLEYLEDIIGTNQYVERIEEAYKQLEMLNEKRTAAVQMVKLAEKEKEGLENVKNEAEAYMLKELSLLRWQEKATMLASEDATSHIAELHKDISVLEENVANEREKIQQNSNNLKELEAVHKTYMERQEELDNELRLCKEEFKKFERQDLSYREDLKHMKQKLKKLEDKIEKDSSKLEEIVKENEEASTLIPRLEEDIPKLQKILLNEETILEEIIESSRDETERYHTELKEVRAELEPWDSQIIVHKGKLEVAFNESKLLNEKHNAGRAAFEDAKKQISILHEKIRAKNSDISDAQTKLEANRLEALEARKIGLEYTKKQDSLIPCEQAARQRVTEISSTLEAEKSQSSVLKAILQAKESKEIDGIYGRLGDLGAIEETYDVAISVACPGLDYIVVETTSAAVACVNLLKRKDIGKATFLILEKQMHLSKKVNESFKTPEGVPRLFDLVSVKDERLKLAFFSVLGKTLVAKDLDQAKVIAYGRGGEIRRVVTLRGEVVENSGTMSGGGSKPRGGKMGRSVRVSVSGEALASAEKELTELDNQINELRQKIADASRRSQASEKAETHLKMQLAKCETERDSLNEQYSYLEKQLHSLEVMSHPKQEELMRLKELGEIVAVEEKELESLHKCSSSLKQRASELQNKIENAGGEVFKKQKSKVAKIQSDIDSASTEVNRLKVKVVAGEKMVKNIRKGIDESKQEKERMTKEKEKLKSSFKDIEQRAFVVQENYKKTQELIDKHRDVLDKAKAEYNSLKKTMDELRTAEVDTEYKMRDMKKVSKEWESKVKAFNKVLDDLQRKLALHMEQIQKDGVDPVKVHATMSDQSFNQSCDLKRSREMVALLEAQLKEMNPNLDSISEYQMKAQVYNQRVGELHTATLERDDLKKQYDGLRKKRLDEFMVGFNIISLKLKEMYQMITLGGDAELELVDSLDPFSEGVVFSVRPPKKSWKNIANLSGGEKTLSSLALVFALHHYKPTPLYVMDEIDAALDFKNVSIVGHYVKDRTRDAQFIIISLRNNMFELADRLVGIYKTDNCTKSITINPESFVDCSTAA